MSDLPPVAYLTRDGQWFARAYEHLDAVAYTRVAGALRRYHDERDALRAIVAAYDAEGETDAKTPPPADLDAAFGKWPGQETDRQLTDAMSGCWAYERNAFLDEMTRLQPLLAAAEAYRRAWEANKYYTLSSERDDARDALCAAALAATEPKP